MKLTSVTEFQLQQIIKPTSSVVPLYGGFYRLSYKYIYTISQSRGVWGRLPLRAWRTPGTQTGRLLGKIRNPAPRNANRNAQCAVGQSSLHLGLPGLTSFGRPKKQGGTGGTGVTCLLPQKGGVCGPPEWYNIYIFIYIYIYIYIFICTRCKQYIVLV